MNTFGKITTTQASNWCLFVLLCGCGSGRYDFETVPIEGTVTLNGEPLPHALVIFQPDEGRLASGYTNEEGNYSLVYLEGKQGVLPGKHKVMITTELKPDPDSNDPEIRAGRPELVPIEYHRQSRLEVEVSPGDQSPIDFELEGTFQHRPHRKDRRTGHMRSDATNRIVSN